MYKEQENTLITGYRIISLLQLFLNKKGVSINRALESLQNNPITSQINCNKVILKYINTLKAAGYIIEKISENYTLKSIPTRPHFEDKDIQALANIFLNSNNVLTEITKKPNLEKLKLLLSEEKIDTIQEILNKELATNMTYHEQVTLEECETICADMQRIEVLYFNGNETENIIAEPQCCVHRKGFVYLNVFDIKNIEMRLLNIKLIKDIRQLPIKSKYKYNDHKVKIKLKGKLAKSYTLRKKEMITEKDIDYITVATSYKDKTRFIKRILRYGNSCEIISPQKLRREINEYISSTLEQYNLEAI